MPLDTHVQHCLSVNRHTHTSSGLAVLLSLLPAVVAELDDVVLVAVPLGVHYETEQSFILLLPIDHHPPAEEPVTAVFTGVLQCKKKGFKKKVHRSKNYRGKATQVKHKASLWDTDV